MLEPELAPVLGPGLALALEALLVRLLIFGFVPLLIARVYREAELNMYPKFPVSKLLGANNQCCSSLCPGHYRMLPSQNSTPTRTSFVCRASHY